MAQHTLHTVRLLTGLAWGLLGLITAAHGAPGEIRLPTDRVKSVSASSESDAQDRGRAVYQAQHLHDGRDWSAWGSAPHDRRGAWVRLEFGRVEYLSRLVFVPGDARNRTSFEGCARPAKITLSTEQGSHTVDLKDKRWRQEIPLDPPLRGRALQIDIDGVHGRGNVAGVCLSELKLYIPRAILDALPAVAREVEKALNDLEDEDRFQGALVRLRRIGGPALPALLRRLDPDRPQLAVKLLKALASLHDRHAIPAIEALYAQGSDELRHHALLTLTALGSAEHLQALVEAYEGSADPQRRREMLQALAQSGHRSALPLLIEALEGEPGPLQHIAAEHLARFGAAAAPVVERLLASPKPHQRAAAAQALGDLDHPEALSLLQRLLGDVDGLVQGAALRSLAHRAPDQALEQAEYGVNSQFADVRSASAYTLGRLRPEAGFDALEAMLNDQATSVRIAAVRALAGYGPRGRPLLQQVARRSGDSLLSIAAAEAIAKQPVAEAELASLLDAWFPAVHEIAIAALQARGLAGSEAIIQAATGAHPELRQRALQAVDLTEPGAPERLLVYAGTAPPEALPDVLERLAASKRPEAASVALQILQSTPAPEVRQAAMVVLGDCGADHLVAPALIKGVEDDDPAVRLAAVQSIGRRRLVAGAEALEHTLTVEVPRPQKVATYQALGRLGMRRSLQPLIDTYRRTFLGAPYDPPLRAEIVAAIGEIGGTESLEVLIDAAIAREKVVRMAAMKGLR